jgi:hypothetical protein
MVQSKSYLSRHIDAPNLVQFRGKVIPSKQRSEGKERLKPLVLGKEGTPFGSPVGTTDVV